MTFAATMRFMIISLLVVTVTSGERGGVALYAEKNFKGVSFWMAPPREGRCTQLPKIFTVKSINTNGNCIELRKRSDCTLNDGETVQIMAPGTPAHHSLYYLGFDDNAIQAIRLCDFRGPH
ncbi:hypothetical protein PMAYCL1PPCAC_26088 [Pristionchus mayeri]|uniref:Uncharacterized protein n=1 Tax=Pristionchus mayeri TaxID=1317129 RepID=A0AAN5D3C3_9BILA|nr:hypothetical protein PMAYCL1PPCAC_26088 [Pristionchus mayeri]